MSRAARLLDLLQALRRRRGPASGHTLAAHLGVSLRTLYRDIQTLKGQGAMIDGEAGVGYVLRPGFLLPPLMFTEGEIEALVLGARWVMMQADAPLAAAARDAVARIGAVLPEPRREIMDDLGLLAGPSASVAGTTDLTPIRTALRSETKLRFTYRDAKGMTSERLVWPVALAFFDHVRVMVAWCELRDDFRRFRVDRIDGLAATDLRYARRRRTLLKAWREKEGVQPP